MNYTGCMGNTNRFMTKDECDNSCKHEFRLVRAKTVCSLPKQKGLLHCTNTSAKWYYHHLHKICKPFYYSGCGGNDNRFDSLEECEEACPNTFPPEITVAAKVLVVEEGFPAFLSVNVEANPPPIVTWQQEDQ